ncbi:MAG: HDOD domain-containing protein [Planctomycetes bacterium]|nr:HDOD domain-containing protein [Planctomycetota bacterium]
MDKVDPDLAFAGALLQDYLLPVISNELYDTYLELVTNRDDHPANICNYERDRFKWDHAIAGACLARRWHLPDDIACCILFQHYGLKIFAHPQLGRSAVVPVALSAMLPDEIRQQTDGLEQLAQLGRKWAAFDLQKLAETVDEEHKKMGLGVRNSFPLAPRCKAVLQTLSA